MAALERILAVISETLSHYRIEEELGRGGMGIVYRARDNQLQRTVALKLLHLEVASHAERRARILAEARAAAALNHPGIITTIYEVGEQGENVFIAMELATGHSLREMIRRGEIVCREQVRLGAQLAEALAAAHAQGVVHGDVKPENIVQSEGRVKLLDFGIARRVAEQTLTTIDSAIRPRSLAESQIVGTVAYMSPEVLRGESPDARADLFSLGVVLYEIAAGCRPFPGPTLAALVTQILHEPAPPLSTIRSDIPLSWTASLTNY